MRIGLINQSFCDQLACVGSRLRFGQNLVGQDIVVLTLRVIIMQNIGIIQFHFTTGFNIGLVFAPIGPRRLCCISLVGSTL